MSNRISLSDILWGVTGTLAVVVLWEFAARGGFINAAIFPSPTLAIGSATEKLDGTDVIQHIGWSMFRVLIGFLLGAIAGILIGIAAGWYKFASFFFLPLIELFRPIPPLAWVLEWNTNTNHSPAKERLQ